MFFSLAIPAGTIVMSSKRGMVTLLADVEIIGATRDTDGAFRYSIGDTKYIVSAGCCTFRECAGFGDTNEGWTHENGLIAFV